MKHYDIIVIGSGSAMNIVSSLLGQLPDLKVALVEKDPVGGICLTRGCIPSKMILYSAEVATIVREAERFGVHARIERIDFEGIMGRMRHNIGDEIKMIEHGLKSSPNIDLYQTVGEFVSDYTMKVGDDLIKGDRIIICSGSRPFIPEIRGLKEAGYLTSTSFLKLRHLPQSMVIVGGGYIAAEYGHFLAAMGSKVTILGRNLQFVPQEEPEVSTLLKRELSKRMTIHTGVEVVEVVKEGNLKRAIGIEKATGRKVEAVGTDVLIAAGRASYSNILHPERTGIETDSRGWIKVNKYLETIKPNIWALGDAIGVHLFKHVANYESQVVYYNAFTDHKVEVDYHAVPSAVFTYPEVASVGMKEAEAIKKGHDILVGKYLYENTAKGEAMMLKDYFVKVIVEREGYRILGAHIIGPQASVLIQEIINLMYTEDGSAMPIFEGMHIHPALNEVVERAFYNLTESELAPHHHHHEHEHSHEHSHTEEHTH